MSETYDRFLRGEWIKVADRVPEMQDHKVIYSVARDAVKINDGKEALQ